MAQQQQNITISAPGFQGLNTEDSPLQQDPSFCLVADNAVVDKFGRIGSRKAWDEFTTAINVTYSTDPSTTRTDIVTNRIGNGVAGGTPKVLASLSVFQYDASDNLVQTDYFVCELNNPSAGTFQLDELTLPTLTDDSKLEDCQFVGYNDAIYVFSEGNECMKYDGTSLSLLFTGTLNVDYIPPQDDNGVIAPEINGDIATAAFGRLWVAGVNGDYETIYYSDLLIGEQWYDGKATPTDSQNTAGIIDVAQYWPNGRDRIVALAAHNNFLFVFGRQSILVYSGLAGDPADVSGARLEDSIPGIGCVSRDAVTNIGSDVLFVDDSGVRSAGRTIQEKSVPLGDLTANIRRDITDQLAATADKASISLCYWADENLAVLLFSNEGLAYAMEMRAPSQTGALKVTRWTDCRFKRSCYWESAGTSYVLLAANQDSKGLLYYNGYLQYDLQPYEFKYESNALTFGQPANEKFIKQIDYTIVATQTDADAWAGWGFSGRLEYTKSFSVSASAPALYGVGLYNVDSYGPGLTTIRRYRINTKGRGESVIVGLRTNIAGNSCSLQELNIQTLLGRLI